MMASVAFMICAGAVFYSYVLFPILLALVAPRKVASEPDPEVWPSVSILLSAYNEEKHIVARLKNLVSLTFPAEKIEILVGSDGSTDNTNELIAGVGDQRIHFTRMKSRGGKPRVLNTLAAMARNELLVFTDANTMFYPDAINRLARHFSNPAIGGVCGQLILEGVENRTDEGAYWRLETYLKTRESNLDSCLGANGGIYAIRRSLWSTIPDNALVDDFLVGMRVREQGYRMIYDPEAVALEDLPTTVQSEVMRRVRIGAGAFQAFVLCWRSLLPWRGIYTWSYWSHKVLRWFGPFFLLGAFLANMAMPKTATTMVLLALQIVFYLLAGIGAVYPKKKLIFSAPHYFVAINWALLRGFARLVTGRQRPTWQRTAR